MGKFFKPSRDFNSLLFVNFLKSNGAYESFMRNSSESDSFSSIALLKSFNPRHYIVSSFYWDYTPEGKDYWNRLDDKWRFLLSFFNL